MQTELITKTANGQSCDIHFYRRWSGYTHPVTPSDPLYLEEALATPHYFRVWLCAVDGDPQFTKFERVNNRRTPVSGIETDGIPPGPAAFEIDRGAGRVRLGAPIPLAEIDAFDEFLFHTGDAEAPFERLEPHVETSFSYEYDAFGVLISVTIVNFDGETSVLTPGEE